MRRRNFHCMRITRASGCLLFAVALLLPCSVLPARGQAPPRPPPVRAAPLPAAARGGRGMDWADAGTKSAAPEAAESNFSDGSIRPSGARRLALCIGVDGYDAATVGYPP